jgi:hypothetical protein
VKPVDPILTCLVIEIVINEELFFSSSKYDDSSLFSHEKRLEMRKNKVWYPNVFIKNQRD